MGLKAQGAQANHQAGNQTEDPTLNSQSRKAKTTQMTPQGLPLAQCDMPITMDLKSFPVKKLDLDTKYDIKFKFKGTYR